jgi:RNA polymerase sigma-70 factor (ECF subfamily)
LTHGAKCAIIAPEAIKHIDLSFGHQQFSRPYPFERSGGIVGAGGSPEAAENLASPKPDKKPRLLLRAKQWGRKPRALDELGETHLVALAQRGDQEAVGELYRRHVEPIYRYTYVRVRDVNLAEDLTAQVFLKALEGLDRYEPRGVPFRSWLYRIAQARIVDHWRRQARRREVTLADSMPALDPSPEEVAMAQSQWETTVNLLDALTDEQRDVIIMRFLEELSLAEIAQTLGKTVGAVKALQHRGLASLARLLSEVDGLET